MEPAAADGSPAGAGSKRPLDADPAASPESNAKRLAAAPAAQAAPAAAPSVPSAAAAPIKPPVPALAPAPAPAVNKPAAAIGPAPAGPALNKPASAAGPAASAAAAVPREAIYRLVLDVVDMAAVIGRGGATVRQIEEATGGRVRRVQEPPGAHEQLLVVWCPTPDLPSPGRAAKNAAQEALLECMQRVLYQESAPAGQASVVRLLINRSQEQGVADSLAALAAAHPGASLALKPPAELPACALDNDVLVELTGDRSVVMDALETLSHVLREHPITERPGGPSPALQALTGQAPAGPRPAAAAGAPPAAAVPRPAVAPAPALAPPPMPAAAAWPAAGPPAGGYGAPAYGGGYPMAAAAGPNHGY